MNENVNVVAVHVANRWALTESGLCLYISDFFDDQGEDTSDPEQAVVGICKCSDGWLTINLNEFQEVDYLH